MSEGFSLLKHVLERKMPARALISREFCRESMYHFEFEALMALPVIDETMQNVRMRS